LSKLLQENFCFQKNKTYCKRCIPLLYIFLDFFEIENVNVNLRMRGVEKELKDGMGAAFTFKRNDGLQIRLAHEPVYGKPKSKLV
jgi:hypothetical protein